jgi:hypothetical protein
MPQLFRKLEFSDDTIERNMVGESSMAER